MKYQHVTLIIMAVLAVAALFWFLNSKKSCNCDNEYDYEDTSLFTRPGYNLDIVPKKCPSGTYKQTINGIVACLGKGQNEGCYTTRNSPDGGKTWRCDSGWIDTRKSWNDTDGWKQCRRSACPRPDGPATGLTSAEKLKSSKLNKSRERHASGNVKNKNSKHSSKHSSKKSSKKSSSRCSKPGHVMKHGKCVCRSYTMWNPNTKRCESPMCNGGIWDNRTKKCKSNPY